LVVALRAFHACRLGEITSAVGALVCRRPKPTRREHVISPRVIQQRGAISLKAHWKRAGLTDRRIRRMRANAPSSQGIANSLGNAGARIMRCFFLRQGYVVDVEMLPGLSELDAIAKAHSLFQSAKPNSTALKFGIVSAWSSAIPNPERPEMMPVRGRRSELYAASRRTTSE
jgi:hypothetical protein